MSISTTGKIEAAAAVTSIAVGIAGAIMIEPLLLAGAAITAAVATALQLNEAKKRRDKRRLEDRELEKQYFSSSFEDSDTYRHSHR